jgi:hypothetical protein
MQGMILALLVCGVLISSGCGGPVKVRVSTLGADPATVQLRPVEGTERTEPEQCVTPCSIRVPRETRQLMTVTSPGHYPASLEFSGWDAAYTTNAVRNVDGEVPLVVPMVERAPLQRR